MGRIRTIKPEILTDAKAVRLSDSAWRLWVSTWLIADDAGRFPADPMVLGGQIFPSRALTEVSGALSELSSLGFVRLYEVNSETFGTISGWEKHQKINRPSGPKFPAPCGEFSEPSVSLHGGLDADHDHDHDRDHDRPQTPEGGARGGSGKEAKPLDPDALKVADYLRAQMLRSKPDNAIGKRKWRGEDSVRRRWAQEFERMARIDERDQRRSCELIRWVHDGCPGYGGQFVVDSAKAMRSKWDRIDSALSAVSKPKQQAAQDWATTANPARRQV